MNGMRMGWLAGGLAATVMAATLASGAAAQESPGTAAQPAPQTGAQSAPAAPAIPAPTAAETAPETAPAPAVPAPATAAAPADPAILPPAPAPAPAETPEVLLPTALSPWGMFMAADVVVKGVMIGLAFASLVTWTIGLAKLLEVTAARLRLRRGLRAVLAAGRLSDLSTTLGQRGGAAGLMVRAAQHEVEASALAIDAMGADGLLDRVASSLSRIEARAGRRLAIGTGILATIGATAPFVGLFGTVWGIMNTFTQIGAMKDTSLSTVAPGIAEALFATGIGLAAAIPAILAYNKFTTDLSRYNGRLATAIGVFSGKLSKRKPA